MGDGCLDENDPIAQVAALSVLSVNGERPVVRSAALCSCTSGGEGCGKRRPDRCKRRKGEMQWYVYPYMRSPLPLYGLFPGDCVQCYTLDSWANAFPLNSLCRCAGGRQSLISALQFHYVDSRPGVVSPSLFTLKARVNC